MEAQQKLELKIIALKEGFKTRVATILDECEDRIAELRIELTEQNQKLTAFDEENQNLQGLIVELQQRISDLELEAGREQVVQEEAGASEAPAEDSNDSN